MEDVILYTCSQQFVAFVSYTQPSFEELKRRFSYVVPEYSDGKNFAPVERCKAVSKKSREVTFEYVLAENLSFSDQMLIEMDSKGLRPALYEELLCFAEKYPDEQRKYPIIALGSEVDVGGHRRIATLFHRNFLPGDGPSLFLDWFAGERGGHQFLAVHEQA